MRATVRSAPTSRSGAPRMHGSPTIRRLSNPPWTACASVSSGTRTVPACSGGPWETSVPTDVPSRKRCAGRGLMTTRASCTTRVHGMCRRAPRTTIPASTCSAGCTCRWRTSTPISPRRTPGTATTATMQPQKGRCCCASTAMPWETGRAISKTTSRSSSSTRAPAAVWCGSGATTRYTKGAADLAGKSIYTAATTGNIRTSATSAWTAWSIPTADRTPA